MPRCRCDAHIFLALCFIYAHQRSDNNNKINRQENNNAHRSDYSLTWVHFISSHVYRAEDRFGFKNSWRSYSDLYSNILCKKGCITIVWGFSSIWANTFFYKTLLQVINYIKFSIVINLLSFFSVLFSKLMFYTIIKRRGRSSLIMHLRRESSSNSGLSNIFMYNYS